MDPVARMDLLSAGVLPRAVQTLNVRPWIVPETPQICMGMFA